jgi:hypothetical protein
MASDQRPPKPDFERWLVSQALTASQRVRDCSNGAESGRFVRVKGVYGSEQGLPAAPIRSAIGQELRVDALEMQLDGPCLEAGPGSLSEMHLMRVASLDSLLQIIHLTSVPPVFIHTYPH